MIRPPPISTLFPYTTLFRAIDRSAKAFRATRNRIFLLRRARIDRRDAQRLVDEAVVGEPRRVGAARAGVADDLEYVAVGKAHAARRKAVAGPQHDVVAAALDQQAGAVAAQQPRDALDHLEVADRTGRQHRVPDAPDERGRREARARLPIADRSTVGRRLDRKSVV